jgi:hypothetical protein
MNLLDLVVRRSIELLDQRMRDHRIRRNYVRGVQPFPFGKFGIDCLAKLDVGARLHEIARREEMMDHGLERALHKGEAAR